MGTEIPLVPPEAVKTGAQNKAAQLHVWHWVHSCPNKARCGRAYPGRTPTGLTRVYDGEGSVERGARVEVVYRDQRVVAVVDLAPRYRLYREYLVSEQLH